MKKMGGTAKMNALRSMVVVIGASAFGYLTLQLGFKPYLEKAQLEQERLEALLQAQSAASEAGDGFGDGFHNAGNTLSDGLSDSGHKL